jgi:hypothetical protein
MRLPATVSLMVEEMNQRWRQTLFDIGGAAQCQVADRSRLSRANSMPCSMTMSSSWGVIGRRLTAPDACNHSLMALIQHAAFGLLHRHSQTGAAVAVALRRRQMT